MSAYPASWASIAWSTKEAADWRCVRCGHPDRPFNLPRGQSPCDENCSHQPDGKQRVLTVHHLDGDKSNCRWWNLTALCQVCHLSIQGRVKMHQRWPFEHSEWFKPYVAGYYAFTVLGEDLSWSEVEARMAELIEAGQPELSR